MKKILSLSLIVFSFISCQDRQRETQTPPALIQPEATVVVNAQEIEMTIEGMMCAIGCAATIEKKLNTTPGIVNATVDFDSKQAKIRFDASVLNTTQIETVINGVGEAYSVSRFERIK
ncbi:MAG: heavy-metal-associated domain-containing protein [Flavobacteriaceae bacterium]